MIALMAGNWFEHISVENVLPDSVVGLQSSIVHFICIRGTCWKVMKG